jgi:hypothetical protein
MKAANQAKWQRRAKKSLKSQKLIKLPLKQTLNASSPLPLLDRHYLVFSLNHPISKSSINFVYILSPFGNELIKHNSREARDAMHEIKIMRKPTKTRANPHKRPQRDNK